MAHGQQDGTHGLEIFSKTHDDIRLDLGHDNGIPMYPFPGRVALGHGKGVFKEVDGVLLLDEIRP